MNPSSAELLTRLELRLLDPQVRRDPAEVGALLAESFVEIGRSGRIYTKSEVVEALRIEEPRTIVPVDFETRSLGPGAALVTYRTVDREVETWRTSIWVEASARWLMVFHQATDLATG